MNTIVIMGRITKTPELKTTNSGVAVTSFNVAVERNYAPQGQERVTDFIPVVAWKKTAEFITRYFQKGQMIAVQGELQTREYTDQYGGKKKVFEVIASNVSFCGGKQQDAPTQQDASVVAQMPPVDVPKDDFTVLTDADDDLPF